MSAVSHPRAGRTGTWFVVVVALCAAGLHLLPYLHAWRETPQSHRFTGNVHRTPDMMQYRAWFRQTDEGVMIPNRLTREPNPPHMILPVQWTIGNVSRTLGVDPEFVYAVIGAPFAALLVLLVDAFVGIGATTMIGRRLLLLAVSFGGGAGAWIRVGLDRGWFSREFRATIDTYPIFEGYFRGHYPVAAYFDTHVLAIWCSLLLAMFFLRRAVMSGGLISTVAATLASFAVPFIHLYSGVTLVSFLCGISVVNLYGRSFERRSAVALLAAFGGTAMGIISWWWFYRRAGFSPPDWREPTIPFAIVAISYPLAAIFLPFGLRKSFTERPEGARFLFGWALGGLAILLSGPFYRYSSRGAYTISIPLMILAYHAWSTFPRTLRNLSMPLIAALIAVTPLWETRHWWKVTSFRADRLETFLDADADALIEAARKGAGSDDLLLGREPEVNWFGPYWPGRFEAGHWFLTQHYEAKMAAFEKAMGGSAEELAAYLDGFGGCWLLLGPGRDRQELERTPGIEVVLRNSRGTLYRIKS